MKYMILFFILVINIKGSYAQTDILRFNVQELQGSLQTSGQNWHQFLNTETIRAGLYSLPIGAVDKQQPHDQDELYLIISGHASLKVGDSTYDARPGEIIYVKAGAPHQFINITEKLISLVIFSKATPAVNDPLSQSYSLLKIETRRQESRNVWNAFHKSATMNFGLYMLPKNLGGDSTLVHKWDELNIINKGTGKFSVNGKVLNVNPGDIIFVKRGLGHYFHDLQEDLDIFILFEKKSVQQ